MLKGINFWSRKLHRWGAIATCIPMLLVITSGLVLQLKKQVAWVQPPTKKGAEAELVISFDEILEVAKADTQAGISSWDDIDRLDVRPGKGVVKVRSKQHWEIQVDSSNGEVLFSGARNSDWIESLHDGSWFGDWAKLYLFLPNGLVLFGLWLSGAYLWYLPIMQKRANRKRRALRKPPTKTEAED